ncbi:MAG TPA: DUF5681 domain-containing protein [Stellaceae bacterium]|nr:DUF5681 domain-containing protein [Stellaceae bacterium]
MPPGDYEIGYKRPPLHTRFQKGRSGNPRGRPRGSKNLAGLLAAALNQPVVVVDNGQRRTMTKRDLVLVQLVNRSAKADLRATKILIDILQDVERRAAPVVETTAVSTAADREIVERLIARIRNAPQER